MERDQLIAPAALTASRGRAAASGWLPSLVAAACCFYLVMVVVLGASALLPSLFGMTSTTIVSGSMTPRINVGDVVVSRPVDADDVDSFEAGDVVTFRDPEQDRLVTHRIIEVLDDGTFRTRGDANRDADRTPVPRDHVVARPIVLVPMAGLPAHWLSTGSYVHVVGFLGVTAAAFVVARSQRYQPKHLKRKPLPRRLAPTMLVAVLVAGAAYDQRSALAAFTGGANNATNTLAAATIDAPSSLSGTPGCVLVLPQVSLSWTEDADADGHVVWRSATSGGTPSQIGTTTGTTFTDTTVSLGTTYFYTVTSTAGTWTTGPSNEVQVAVPLTCL